METQRGPMMSYMLEIVGLGCEPKQSGSEAHVLITERLLTKSLLSTKRKSLCLNILNINYYERLTVTFTNKRPTFH